MTLYLFAVPGGLDAAVTADCYPDAVALLMRDGVTDFLLKRWE